jgi:hypothetical protein
MQRARLETALLALINGVTSQQMSRDVERNPQAVPTLFIALRPLDQAVEQTFEHRQIRMAREILGQKIEGRLSAARLLQDLGETQDQRRTRMAAGQIPEQFGNLIPA